MMDVKKLYEARPRPAGRTVKLPAGTFADRNSIVVLLNKMAAGRIQDLSRPHISGGKRVDAIDDDEALKTFEHLEERFEREFPRDSQRRKTDDLSVTFDVTKREAELLLLTWEAMPYMTRDGKRNKEYERVVSALELGAGRKASH